MKITRIDGLVPFRYSDAKLGRRLNRLLRSNHRCRGRDGPDERSREARVGAQDRR